MPSLSRKPYILSILALLPVALFLHLHENAVVPQARPFSEFPAQLGGWTMVNAQSFSEGELAVLNPTAYLSRFYRGPGGERVHLYLGYHGAGGIHSPRNCLLGSGWFQESREEKTFAVDGRKVHLVETVLAKGNVRTLMLYWFQMREKTMQSEYALKIQEIVNSALYRRKDESFVRISVEFVDGVQNAREKAYGFLADFWPTLNEFIPE